MTPAQKVTEFVHAHNETQPLQEQVANFRAIAAVVSDPALARHFHACADELSVAAKRCRQLALDFGKGGTTT